MEEELFAEAIKFAREKNRDAIMAYNQMIRRILKEERQEYLNEVVCLSPTIVLSDIYFKDNKKKDIIKKSGMSYFAELVLVDFISYILESKNEHFSRTYIGDVLKIAIEKGRLYPYLREKLHLNFSLKLGSAITKLLRLYDSND